MVIFHYPLERRTCTSVYVDGYSALSHSRLNDLTAWLRAAPIAFRLGLVVHVPLSFRICRAHQLRELRRRVIKLPLKKLGHAIEDWVANQSPMGNSSIIDAKAFEWWNDWKKTAK